MTAGVLLDHCVVLQRPGRLAFFRVFMLTCGVGALAATLYPLLWRMGRLYVARRVEQRRPELGNALISYLQVRDDPRTPGEVKVLLGRRVAPHVRDLDAGVAVERGRYVRLGLVLAAVGLAFLGYGLLSPKSAAVSLARLLAPRADIHPPTATRLLSVEPGDLYAVRGQRPTLRVRVGGVGAETVYAVWSGSSFEDRRLLLERREGGLWRTTFPPVLEDGAYHVVAGDTRSERFVVRALPRPVVEEVRLELRPPAYTGLFARTVEGGSVEALRGTEVTLRAGTTLPPAEGHIRFGSGREVPLRPFADEKALTGQFEVARSDVYSIHFQSVAYPGGAVFRNESPIEHTITSLQDQPPTVALHAPPDGVEMDPQQAARIVYSAADDFGLGRVRLHYRVNRFVRPAVTLAEPRVRELERAEHLWDLSELLLRPGQTITYRMEVADNRPPVPQTASSEERRIVIPGPEPQERPAAEKPQPPKREQPPPESEQPEPAQPPQQPSRRDGGEAEPARPTQPPEAGKRDRVRDALRCLRKAVEGEKPETGTEREPAKPDSAKPRPEEARRPSNCACAGSTCEGGGGPCPNAGAGQGDGSGKGQGQERGDGAGRGDSAGGAQQPGEEAGEEGQDGAGGQEGQADEGQDGGTAQSRGPGADTEAPTGAPSAAGAGGEGRGVRSLPAPGPPEETLPEAGAGNAAAELEQMLEADELPEEFLADLGTNREELRKLIEEYKSRVAAAAEGAAEPARTEPSGEAGRVLPGAQQAAPDVRASGQQVERPSPDQLRTRFEGGSERLSPYYRELVNRYYQALSREP